MSLRFCLVLISLMRYRVLVWMYMIYLLFNKIQNCYLRLVFGVSKNDRILFTLKVPHSFNMASHLKLHMFTYHNSLIHKASPYLHRKTNYRTDVHNINIRFKGELTISIHKITLFKRGVSDNAVTLHNKFSAELKFLKSTAI